MKTWSRQVNGQEEELTDEKISTEDDVDSNDSTEAESFQSLIHMDVIERTVHKDKRGALMERQDRTKHSKLTWICKVCGFKSTSQSHVKSHVETHIEGLEFVCDLCGKINKTTAAFAVHQHRCSKRLSLSNPNVSVRKNAPWEYDSYFREESPMDKPYKCNQCDFTSNGANTLKAHLKSHIGEKSYKCNHCDVAYFWQSGLRRHMKTHAGE